MNLLAQYYGIALFLVWDSPEVDPEMKTWMQTVFEKVR